MISPEGEAVNLKKDVIATEEVDVWLNSLEASMKATMKELYKIKWNDYKSKVLNKS